MAVRYSGDVEVRMHYDPARSMYRATVRDEDHLWRGTAGAHNPPTPETYDRLARAMIHRAERDLKKRLKTKRDKGRLEVSRLFQAPCPDGAWE